MGRIEIKIRQAMDYYRQRNLTAGMLEKVFHKYQYLYVESIVDGPRRMNYEKADDARRLCSRGCQENYYVRKEAARRLIEELEERRRV